MEPEGSAVDAAMPDAAAGLLLPLVP